MRIESSSPNFIATRLWNISFAEAGKQWTEYHNGSSKGGSFFPELGSLQVFKIYVIGLKGKRFGSNFGDFYSNITQQAKQLIYITDIGNIGNGNFFGSQNNGTHHLQGFIFCTLGNYFTS